MTRTLLYSRNILLGIFIGIFGGLEWNSNIIIVNGQLVSSTGKITCFDTKKDIDGVWSFSSNYKYTENPANLPGGFPKTLDGSGIWYIEGTGREAQEIKLTAPKLYTNRAKNVQIFIRYYDKSPRALSLYPVKGPLPLVTLPASTGQAEWTEVKYDVDPSGPIEISAFLSSGHMIAFEKIVLAVDTQLPANASTRCLETGSSSNRPSAGKIATPTTTTVSTSTAKPNNGQCPPTPARSECKCNCLCSCSTCEKS